MTTSAETIAATLRPLLEDAAGPDRLVLTRELEAAGIAPRYARSIARASARLDTKDEAIALATSWAETIAADLERDLAKGTDPKTLAADVPRW